MALRLRPDHGPTWYRCAQACLTLDKVAEAQDACDRGLALDTTNSDFQELAGRIATRTARLILLTGARRDRQKRAEEETLELARALRARKIILRRSTQAPDLEDAAIHLDDPLDASSTLSFPMLLLYPIHGQSDFIKSCDEFSSLADHLAYILPLPWDNEGHYAPDLIDGYMETVSGGLVKVGRKLPLRDVLAITKNPATRVALIDGLVTISIVPASQASGWFHDFKTRKGAWRLQAPPWAFKSTCIQGCCRRAGQHQHQASDASE